MSIIGALSLILKNALPSRCSLVTSRILVTHCSPMSLFGSVQIKTIIFRFRFPQIVVRTAIFAFASVTTLCSRKCISSCKNRFFICSLNLNMGFSNRRTLLVRSGSPVLLAYGCPFHAALMARILYKPRFVARFHGTTA